MAESYIDLDFDTALAESWKSNVAAELSLVYSLLDEVTSYTQSIPGEKDDILSKWSEIANNMADKWRELNNAFEKVSDATQDIIDHVKEGGTQVLENIANFFSGFSL